MISYYDKVIIREVEGEKRSVIIFDQKTHTPVFYSLNKCGMDDVLEILNQNTNGKTERTEE